MDETKEPGIRPTGIVVERIRFDDIRLTDARPKNLRFAYRIERRRIDERQAEVVIHHSLRSAPATEGQPPEGPFALDLSLAVRFSADEDVEMALDEFLRFNGPAQVMPFVREMVANITVRSRHGLVLLPSVNVVALVRRDESTAESAGKTEVSPEG